MADQTMRRTHTGFYYQQKMPPLSARHKHLVEQHMRLVPRLVRQALGGWDPGDDFGDFCQMGYIGLMRASQSFDPDRGVCFSTYAYWWIRAAVRHELARWRPVKVPCRTSERSCKLRRLRQQPCGPDGARLSDEDVCQKIGISKQEMRFLDHYVPTVFTSLDQPASNTSRPFHEEIEDKSAVDPQRRLEVKTDLLKIIHAIWRLPDMRAKKHAAKLPRGMLRHVAIRCIVHGEKQAAIAKEYGVSRERIRQLKNRAMNGLREAIGQ